MQFGLLAGLASLSGCADSTGGALAETLVREKPHWHEGSCSEPPVPNTDGGAPMTVPPPSMLPPGVGAPGSQEPERPGSSFIPIGCGAPLGEFVMQGCEAQRSAFNMPKIVCRGDGGRAYIELRPTRNSDTPAGTLIPIGVGQEGSAYEGELRLGNLHTLLNIESGALAFLNPIPPEGTLTLDGHILQVTARSAPGPGCVVCTIRLGNIITP